MKALYLHPDSTKNEIRFSSQMQSGKVPAPTCTLPGLKHGQVCSEATEQQYAEGESSTIWHVHMQRNASQERPRSPPLQQTATKQALPVILIEPETLGFTPWLIFFSLSLIFLKITVLPLVSELLNVTSLSSCLTFISIVIDLQHKANCFLYLDLLKRTGWHHHQLINTFTQRYAGYHHLIPLCQLFSHHFTL